MAKIRLGFVGVGSMGQAAHLRNYATLPDCEIAAIAELRPGLGQEVARRHGVPRLYSSHREMLEQEKLDGIVAIQQFSMHAQLVPEILRYGVPVMIEKPLADTVENGRLVADAAAGAKAPMYLAYHKRSDPACVCALEKVRRWKASGEAGQLRYIRITMPPGDWIQEGFASNIATNETYEVAGGKWDAYVTFVNYYIHQVNLFRYFLEEDFEVVFADPGGVTLAIRSESGVSGLLEMAPYSTSIDWDESVLVAFEKGWIRVDLPAPLVLNRCGKVTIHSEGPVPCTSSPSLRPWHAMRCQAGYFLKAIRGEPTPLCTASDALKDLLVARQYVDLMSA